MQKIPLIDKLMYCDNYTSKKDLAVALNYKSERSLYAAISPMNPSFKGRTLEYAIQNNIDLNWLFGNSGKIPTNTPLETEQC